MYLFTSEVWRKADRPLSVRGVVDVCTLEKSGVDLGRCQDEANWTKSDKVPVMDS